jgi:NAD+--asparagine ADP-ribosyltransferase
MVLKQKGGDMSKSKKQTKAEIEEAKRAEAIERERQEVVAHAIGAVQHNFGRTSGRVSIYKR